MPLEMSLGQKIREIRRLQGLSQVNLADNVGCTQSKISLIENGSEECDNTMLELIRKALGVEDAPLLGDEYEIYIDRLTFWYDTIRNRQYDHAAEIREKTAVITKLPFEKELIMHFRIFEALMFLFMKTRDITSAEQSLLLAQVYVEDASDVNLYRFYFTKGVLHGMKNELEESLKYYKKAEKYEHTIPESNLSLIAFYFNFGRAYFRVGKFFHAVVYFERADKLEPALQMNISSLHAKANLNGLIGMCFMYMGEHDKAKDKMDSALASARNTGDKYTIGSILHNLGCLHERMKKHTAAIKYLDEAAVFLEGHEQQLLANIYRKAHCLIGMKSTKIENYLQETADFVKEKQDGHFKIMFKSLSCLLAITDDASMEYLIGTTIPHLVKKYRHFDAIVYCNLVESRLRRKRQQKADEISKMARDIYADLMSD